jgi:hypothetical protein
MEKIIFAVVLLHIVAGFGWVVYKLQFQKKKSKDDAKKNKHKIKN